MAVSLNSMVVVSSTLQGKDLHVPISGTGPSLLKGSLFASPLKIACLRKSGKDKKWGFCLSVTDGDRVSTENSDKSTKSAERTDSSDHSSTVTLPSFDPTRNDQFQTGSKTVSGPQIPADVNTSLVTSNVKRDASSDIVKPGLKRSPLTAREKLRAARVLSRYTEPKASKSEFGSKVLDALKESDKGKKKSRLPEAPTNLFDDSKRGLPKQGLTFEFPGGVDAFIIIFSFVFISTLMFATTYLVWKVGAIHFNEY
ncbi:hypothetical protein NMG60_11018367 [Bertholletia excelsa]